MEQKQAQDYEIARFEDLKGKEKLAAKQLLSAVEINQINPVLAYAGIPTAEIASKYRDKKIIALTKGKQVLSAMEYAIQGKHLVILRIITKPNYKHSREFLARHGRTLAHELLLQASTLERKQFGKYEGLCTQGRKLTRRTSTDRFFGVKNTIVSEITSQRRINPVKPVLRLRRR